MIPNFLTKEEIPKELPKEIEVIINELKITKDKEEYLKKTFELITQRHRGWKIKNILLIPKILNNDINKIWDEKNILYCTHLNYLIRIILIKSDLFTDDDIKLKYSLLYYISPHQYLEIKINDKKTIKVDPWGEVYGIKFGDYGHGFHVGSFFISDARREK